ncbi:unnamed protein product [Malus baccata var. baccata]
MKVVVYQIDSNKISKISNGRWNRAYQLLRFQVQYQDSFGGTLARNPNPTADMDGMIPRAHDIERICGYSFLEI